MKKVHGYDYDCTADQLVLYCEMLLGKRVETRIRKDLPGPQFLLGGGIYRCSLCDYGAHSFQKHHTHMKHVHIARTGPFRCLGLIWLPIILRLKENIAVTLGKFLGTRSVYVCCVDECFEAPRGKQFEFVYRTMFYHIQTETETRTSITTEGTRRDLVELFEENAMSSDVLSGLAADWNTKCTGLTAKGAQTNHLTRIQCK
jgi:hypothetical protein